MCNYIHRICCLHLFTELQIGFKHSSYHTFEGVDHFTFEVEVKNDGMSAIPVDFTVTDIEGDSLSEFSLLLDMVCAATYGMHSSPLGSKDYVGLGIMHLQLQPGQRSVQYTVTVVNDNVMEVDEEMFTLHLSTDQDRVATLTGFDHFVVTITDDDSKLHKT